jgi:hypothetical protein
MPYLLSSDIDHRVMESMFLSRLGCFAMGIIYQSLRFLDNSRYLDS